MYDVPLTETTLPRVNSSTPSLLRAAAHTRPPSNPRARLRWDVNDEEYEFFVQVRTPSHPVGHRTAA